ncbi:MAG: polysaccharide biosynthesis C-terminal domain-containing protein, partial [Solobacterium sp.]|nr:polysaccharide biosynthesis C-terminal domain-containing protein [Solobacterium sp.]
ADAYRHHFKPTFQLFIPTIAISVYTMLDRTMVGALYNEEHLSYYKTSIGFVQMFLYFITSIGAVVLPRITNVFYNEEGGEEKAKNLIRTTMKIALMLSVPMCLGMVAVAGNFISWYLPTAPIVADLIRFGSPIIIFISMSNVTGIQYLVPTGMYTQYTISVVTGSIVNFIINSLLIPRYGAYGAIAGSVIAEFCVTCVQLAFVRRKAHIRFFDRSCAVYVIGAAVMMAVVMAVVRVLPVNIAGTVLSIFAGMIVYFIVLYVSKEDLCMKVMGMIRRRKANA